MIPTKFAYLLFVTIMSIPWFICFFLRKDLRKEMLIMSLLIGIGSAITGYVWWTTDWWRPETITGTIIGIEDFLIGFVNGGVAAVIYEVVSGEKQKQKKYLAKSSEILSFCLLCAFVISFGTWWVGLTTFWASSIGMVISVMLLLYYRKDLLKNALLSGLLMAIVSLPAYYISEKLSPGWISSTFQYEHLSGLHIVKAPLEDIVFYFLFGMWTGPFYELWKGEVVKK